VPGEGALKVLPRLPHKGQVSRGPACQVPQYLLAQRFTSSTSAMAVEVYRGAPACASTEALRPLLTCDLHLHRTP
jgi:hypothetical protein